MAVIYKSTITAVQRCASYSTFELLDVVLSRAGSSFRLAIIYRPPPSPNALFFEELEDLIQSNGNSRRKQRLLIVGDLNIHVDDLNDPASQHLARLIDSLSLCQFVSDCTHLGGHTLDLVISDPRDPLVSRVEVGSLFSDHYAVDCWLHMKRPPLPIVRKQFRLVKSIVVEDFSAELSNLPLFTSPAPCLADRLEQYESIAATFEKFAPLQTRSVVLRPEAPWFSSKESSLRRSVRQAERTARATDKPRHWRQFHKLRTQYRLALRLAKASFFKTKIADCGRDGRALWRLADFLLGRKDGSGSTLRPSVKTASNFSEFFIGKIGKIRAALDLAATGMDDGALPIPERVFLTQHDVNDQLASFPTVSISDVVRVVMASPSKTCSLDPLPCWLLKQCLSTLAPAITDIINLSLQSGTFPRALKKAQVIPVLKKKTLDPNDPASYRPVSNLSFLSKTIERSVAAVLTAHFTRFNILPTHQSAYRAGHSTETALLEVTDDILRSVDRGDACMLMLLDLSAAFDTIDHGILLERLERSCGVTGTALSWFVDYLQDRSQAVVIGGLRSADAQLKYGVPQGSVLGPPLYTAYASPVVEVAVLHPAVRVHGFSDDTQFRVTYKARDGAAARVEAGGVLSACLVDSRRFFLRNRLQENATKRELLCVTARTRLTELDDEPVVVDGLAIQPSASVRNLGVILDRSMSMEQQIDATRRNAYYYLRMIRRVRHCLDLAATKLLVHGLVISRLDYGNSLLYGLPDGLLQKLQRVQNAAARLVLQAGRSSRSSRSLLRELNWLPIRERIVYKVAAVTHRCIYGDGPGYLRDLLCHYRPARSLRSADQHLLVVPKFNMQTYGRRSFSVAAPLTWNALPLELRATQSHSTFLRLLKTHLFCKAYVS